MGNCSLKGVTEKCPNSIRVLTDSGIITEFKGPKLARDILNDYPGYGIFRQGHGSSPLADHERLISGKFYYLLPLEKVQMLCDTEVTKQVHNIEATETLNVEWMSQIDEPPKMSTADLVENLASGPAVEVLPAQGNGVWRVKLVINTKQLEEILSEEVNTEALIEKMRMAASSASFTPKRSKSSWVVNWKPALSNVFKLPVDNGKASTII